MVLTGVCTPKFAIEAYVSQLNNLTLVAILLAGFAISFAVSPPEFPDDDTEIPRGVSKILTHLYGGGMLFSGMNCFAATSIALHTVNRLGNACPSKSSTAYMTIKVFFPARKAVQTYIFRGIPGMVVGLVAAFVQSFNLFHGIPAALASIGLCCWFVVLYNHWDEATSLHSEIADDLAVKDIGAAAKANKSICEGMLQ